MAEQFEGDLAGAVFWGADLRGARFRDVDLTGARISHAFVVDVEIDALVERLVVNGVDVTAHVNASDSWYPLRTMLRPTEPHAMQATWAALEAEWAIALDIATGLGEVGMQQSVSGEWSVTDTLRHLVFAMDKWFTAPVLGGGFSPYGLPNAGSRGFPWPGLQLDAAPSTADVLAARAERCTRFRDHLATLVADDLTRSVEVLENGPHQVLDCLFTVFEEEFWHLRYARRDLDVLSRASMGG
jgi:DinB superfamily/Pentapeptide repeats (8 copies)